jgi:hypothetical protein
MKSLHRVFLVSQVIINSGPDRNKNNIFFYKMKLLCGVPYKLLFLNLMILKSFVISEGSTLLTEPCTAVITVFESDETGLVCQTPTGNIYNVPFITSEWIREKEISGELISGETSLAIPLDTPIDPETQSLDLSDKPLLLNDDLIRRQRELAEPTIISSKAIGTRTVLAVKVQANNKGVSVSKSEISDSIFGTFGDQVNLRSQYNDCSHGKLDFAPAQNRNGLNIKIRNGVVTVPVDVSTSQGNSMMVNQVTAEIRRQFGVSSLSDIADHFMYCLPEGTMTQNKIGYAMTNGWLSVFNDKMCTYVSIQMHEVGHNLNLGHSGDSTHSGDNELKYGDKSGLMGFSYTQDETPKMCFNAAKSWYLGWYSDKTMSLSPGKLLGMGNEYSGTIGNIVDYPTSANTVIIQLQQESLGNHWYVGFNAQKGFNIETKEAKNQVVVIEDTNSLSIRRADLNAGDSYTIDNFDGKEGDRLTISVSSINIEEGSAKISLYLEKGPTASPTLVPTTMPTASPPSVPTERPSVSPTISPTLVPTTMPTASPTESPTQTPTRDEGARKPSTPTIDTTTTAGQDCKGSLEICAVDSDCCAGFECRRGFDSNLNISSFCRSAAKNSKDKLDRPSWGNRGLRGAATMLTDELQDD